MPRDLNRRSQKPLRAELRNAMTAPEVILWSRLQGKQLGGLKFRRQYGVGPYVLDFYCPRVRLGIELDGESHFESEAAEERDRRRTAAVEQAGITLLRDTNYQIGTELESVPAAILCRAEELLADGS